VSKKIIFAIDDSETILTVLEDELGEDYTLITLDAAEKIFKQLKKIRPDLILLDYYLPGMSCREAMKQLKSEEQYENIPIIIMSGSNYPELIDEIQAMGAVDFVNKPFEDGEVLRGCVKKWINNP